MIVRFGSARIDRLVDELLDDDDHPVRGERGLLLAAEQAPDLGVAGRVGALGVDDRDVRLERRHRVDLAVAVRRLDLADQRVRLRQVGLEVAPERVERQVRGARRVPPDHAEVAVLLELEARQLAVSPLVAASVRRRIAPRPPTPGLPSHEKISLRATPAAIIWS